jgi:Uma2 family endonuclease
VDEPAEADSRVRLREHCTFDRQSCGPQVFEVLSPDDRWSKILEKVAEYLHAGVLAVCVVDPERQKVHIYRNEREAKILSKDEKLQLPEVFARFSVRVREFFETLT